MEKRDAIIVLSVFGVFFIVALWLVSGGYDEVHDRLFIETVYVEASYEEVVIDRPSNTIHLTINGEGNEVIVTKETNLRELRVIGDKNSVELCDGIHNPEIENLGEENSANFFSC